MQCLTEVETKVFHDLLPPYHIFLYPQIKHYFSSIFSSKIIQNYNFRLKKWET